MLSDIFNIYLEKVNLFLMYVRVLVVVFKSVCAESLVNNQVIMSFYAFIHGVSKNVSSLFVNSTYL